MSFRNNDSVLSFRNNDSVLLWPGQWLCDEIEHKHVVPGHSLCDLLENNHVVPVNTDIILAKTTFMSADWLIKKFFLKTQAMDKKNIL